MKWNHKQPNKILRILGILAIAAIASVSLYFIKTEEYKDWMSTEGILINMEQHNSRGGKRHVGSSRSYSLYYAYAVDGKSYDGVDSFSGSIPAEHFIGEQVEVWYNPAYPSHSMYSKPGPGLWPYVPFIFAVPIFFIILGGGFNRKERGLRSL